MKTTQKKTMLAALVASSAFAFVASSSPAAEAGPIVPQGHVCLEYNKGGTDCSFTTYGQCLATASGIGAECYGPAPRNDMYDRRVYGAWSGAPAGRF